MYKNHTHEQMSAVERCARVALGAAMISPVFAPQLSEAGLPAVLALASVYPILTGLVGADPVRALLTNRTAYRLFAAVVGAALIGAAFVVPAVVPGTSLGLLAVLPLAGAYAMFAALIGRAPLAAAAEACRAVVRVVPPAPENVADVPALQGGARHAA